MITCPSCGYSHLNRREVYVRVINPKTMQPVSSRPVHELDCPGCGWRGEDEPARCARP